MVTKGETGRGQGKQKVACNVWEDRSAGGVSVSTRNGAPSRKRCGVNGQMTTVRQATNEYALPPTPYRDTPEPEKVLCASRSNAS